MKLTILGSTGSIGTQALEVVEELKEKKEITITGISGNRNLLLLEEQIRRFHPAYAAVPDEAGAKALAVAVADTNTKILSGREGLCYLAAETGSDMVLSSIVGFAGLIPTLRAVEAGKDIALANKETLVTAGSLFMEAVKKHGVRLLPVDSEHCAIFQSLKSGRHDEIEKILLTASGGPFFGKTATELAGVKKEQALKHPNWSMGAKITIDSATLMNKGLEIMEAKWLFDVEIDDIEVVVQRESIIHSMVQFKDRSVIAQMSLPSMKHPIQYAFTYPDRLEAVEPPVDFAALGALTFARPDEQTFRCLALAKKAGRQGGIMPTVLNAANETAVTAFLQDEIGFLEIADTVEAAMDRWQDSWRRQTQFTAEDLLEIDTAVRKEGLQK
ncbi:1-deoxy-D-xylulose-5-phosphate reductoisomerase [Ructibacterium gallinarum]|uniref:1-deoxy-D-xylulose 5-phosphate reductoisomerase n=1 Tax=Ructibacterium gallinarum TaxID=2779355 RepID=A0A9D5R7S7_9FIRM|nr:1-deoxy-D-xylulose-5-phosphate reductoisomerase [Ructibacterium gallinarum]MBE5039177.1 1-deoxy-D-xylulose-5-phosphate reductoisomerase [Ructibacterium gallinarum]